MYKCFVSCRRRQTDWRSVSWARRCVKETGQAAGAKKNPAHAKAKTEARSAQVETKAQAEAEKSHSEAQAKTQAENKGQPELECSAAGHPKNKGTKRGGQARPPSRGQAAGSAQQAPNQALRPHVGERPAWPVCLGQLRVSHPPQIHGRHHPPRRDQRRSGREGAPGHRPKRQDPLGPGHAQIRRGELRSLGAKGARPREVHQAVHRVDERLATDLQPKL